MALLELRIMSSQIIDLSGDGHQNDEKTLRKPAIAVLVKGGMRLMACLLL
jgi:hypothetical protein